MKRRLAAFIACVVVALSLVVPPSLAGTYTVPTTVKADCSVDVTAALNDWIVSVPNGTVTTPNVLEFGSGKCYRVDGSLGTTFGRTDGSGYQRAYLTFNGNNSTIDGSYVPAVEGVNRAGFSFMYGAGLTVNGFIIKGNHPDPCKLSLGPKCTGGYDSRYEWHHGIAFFASVDSVAKNNTILNVYGDGVTVSQGTQAGEHAKNITMSGNTIDGTGRMGVAVTAADGVTISGNTFDRISYHGVDLEPEGGGPVKSITFASNTLKRHYLGMVVAAAGECQPRSGYVIRDNVMEVSGTTTAPPLWFVGHNCATTRIGLTITGNTLLKTVTDGGPPNYHNSTIRVHDWTDVRINNNRIIQSRIDTGALWLANLAGVKEVKNNDMREIDHVYNYGGNWDGSSPGAYDGPEVDACGNVTNKGGNKPKQCPANDAVRLVCPVVVGPKAGDTVICTFE